MRPSLFRYDNNKEKIAAVELEEDTAAWPRQILVELYRTLPDTADYSPEVKFLQIDEEQGFAVGVVVLSSTTNSALASSEVSSPRRALIPVVVKNHSLCPMDLLMTGKGKLLPLTEERLREALYRPETFDLITKDWDDTQLWNMFFPPGRGDSFGAMGQGSNMGGMGMGMKTSSYELLESLSGAIFEQDIDTVTQTMSDPRLIKVAGKNQAFLGGLKKLSELTIVDAKLADDYEAAVASMYPAQVVQLSFDASRQQYGVKTANRALAHVQEVFLDRGAFLKFAGSELAKRVDTEGTVTISEPVKVLAGAGGDVLAICDYSACGTVYNAGTGEAYTGWLFPELVDVTGAKNPITLFVSQTHSVLQEQIAFSSALSHSDPPVDQVKGTGSFYWQSGSTVATVPMKIVSALRGDRGEITYECVDFLGGLCKVTLDPGTKGVIALPSKRELLMPAETKFVRTDRPGVPLVTRGEKGCRTKDAIGSKHAHVAFYGENSYGIREAPSRLVKVARIVPDLQHDAAMFALCLGGLSASGASATLREAEKLGSTSAQLVDVGTVDFTEQNKVASEKIKEIHALRRDLLKEAAELPDTMSVDSILSLGFVNSENIGTFVSRLPYLEKALSTICELLLASRLGVTEIPELAAARCSKSLNDVTQGLKALALREIRSVS